MVFFLGFSNNGFECTLKIESKFYICASFTNFFNICIGSVFYSNHKIKEFFSVLDGSCDAGSGWLMWSKFKTR